MKKFYLFLIFSSYFLLFTVHCFAQWVNNGTKLSDNNAENHTPFISVTSSGGMYISWMAMDTIKGNNSVMLSAVDASGNILPGWATGGYTLSNPGDNEFPVVLTTEAGDAIVTWYGYPSGSGLSMIYAQKYSAAGIPVWNSGQPIMIAPAANHIDKNPTIVSDRHNGCYISWTRYDNVMSATSPLVFLQHIDSTGSVAKGWSDNGLGVADSNGARQAFPRIALSPDNSAIYVAYYYGFVGLRLKKVLTEDASIDSSWPANGLILSFGPYVWPAIDQDLYLFFDKNDILDIFWLEAQLSADLNSEIYMQRVTSEGKQLFYNPGGKYIGGKGAYSLLDSSFAGTLFLDAKEDGAGNFLLVYANYDDSLGDDINAMKVSAAGYTAWQKIPITTSHACDYQKVVPDGHNGMYIFYKFTTGSGYQLYALAVDSLGKFYNGVSEPGILFGAVDNFYPANPNFDFNIAATCPNKVMVAWDMFRNNQNQLYNTYACNLLNLSSCVPDNTDCTLAVHEIKNDVEVEVFPNPFMSDIMLNIKSSFNDVSFKLYDVTGKIMLQQNLSSSEGLQIIHAANLPNGIYLYNLQNYNTVIKKGVLVKQ